MALTDGMDHPLKKYRDQHGLSQAQLAEILGVTNSAVSRWEAGVRWPEQSQLRKLAEITRIPVSELLGFLE